jgi:hypothetical protein
MHRHTIRLLSVLLLAALAACAPHKPATPKADNFPVVVPFAIDRAGSKVTVEFELPNAIDPYIQEPTLRPVFIGVRRISKSGKLMTDVEQKEWIRRADYLLHDGKIPVRLFLWRYDQGGWQRVILYELHNNRRYGQGKFWYEPITDDDTVHELEPASTDNDALLAAGKYDQEKVYDMYELVQIRPPVPGRYRLEVTNLDDHPLLSGPPYELLVSHYYGYGEFP